MKRKSYSTIRLSMFAMAVMAMCFTLTSCGDDDDDNKDGSANPTKQAGKAVDLGLSVLWADCNVGATTPEDYGDYYAWGETETKTNYEGSTYKWCNGSYKTLTKYNTQDIYGTVDNKTVLEAEDDVAHVKWGGKWRIPTRDEMEELIGRCTWTWTTQNGVKGHKVVGPNGNSIFLPAAGSRYDTSLDGAGTIGTCWSSSLDTSYPGDAYVLGFNSGYIGLWYYDYRFYGHSVRPVCPK